MTLDIKIDISRCKSTAVGPENGFSPADLDDIEPRVLAAHDILARQRRDEEYGFYDLYKDDAVFADLKSAADAFLEMRYDNLVILGIGGSALGATALVTALKPPYYNLASRKARGGAPRIFVMDNIDPVSFRQMMRLCPPKKTLYNVISKSGDTAETITQLLIAVDALEKAVGHDGMKDHLVVTTNPRGHKKSLLHPVADHYGLKEFAVPLNVGGRFSVFSPVAMFPAAMLKMDLDALRDGCKTMDQRCANPDIEGNPAYLRAAVQYIADTRKGKTMSIMMPYADSLRDVADWYRQLWAESLGKQFDLEGHRVCVGQTPIKSLGATDQHSQVQIYREGPNNKIFNIIEVARFEKTLKIPYALEHIPEFGYLRGKSMNKLMAAELLGTIEALKISRRPVSRIVLPRVNAHTVAQLMYMLEIETAMAGRLYNVQTFDQPAVQVGKDIARALMSGDTARLKTLYNSQDR